MIKFLLAILLLSWGVGLYLRSDSREKPKPRAMTSLDAANAVGDEDRHASAAVAPETNAATPSAARESAPSRESTPANDSTTPLAQAPTANPVSAEARELDQAARALVSANEVKPSPAPSDAAPRMPASIGGSGGASPLRPADLRPVDYIPLEEALRGGIDPRWQVVEAGNDQSVRLFRGTTPFIDRSPYYFVPPIADLDRLCPPLASLKITAVLRFDAEGRLAEVVAADNRMAAISKDVFNCQLPPRLLRGEAIPFKTLFVPRAP